MNFRFEVLNHVTVERGMFLVQLLVHLSMTIADSSFDAQSVPRADEQLDL
jgi:hypothetical protein